MEDERNKGLELLNKLAVLTNECVRLRKNKE